MHGFALTDNIVTDIPMICIELKFDILLKGLFAQVLQCVFRSNPH